MRTALCMYIASVCACGASVEEQTPGGSGNQPAADEVAVVVKGLADTVSLDSATVTLSQGKTVLFKLPYPGYQPQQVVKPGAPGFGNLDILLVKMGYVSFPAEIFHDDLVAALGKSVTVEIPLARDVQGSWSCYGQWVTKGAPGNKDPGYQESVGMMLDVPCGCLKLQLTVHADTLSIIGDRIFGKGNGVTWSGQASDNTFTVFRAANDEPTSGYKIMCSR